MTPHEKISEVPTTNVAAFTIFRGDTAHFGCRSRGSPSKCGTSKPAMFPCSDNVINCPSLLGLKALEDHQQRLLSAQEPPYTETIGPFAADSQMPSDAFSPFHFRLFRFPCVEEAFFEPPYPSQTWPVAVLHAIISSEVTAMPSANGGESEMPAVSSP